MWWGHVPPPHQFFNVNISCGGVAFPREINSWSVWIVHVVGSRSPTTSILGLCEYFMSWGRLPPRDQLLVSMNSSCGGVTFPHQINSWSVWIFHVVGSPSPTRWSLGLYEHFSWRKMTSVMQYRQSYGGTWPHHTRKIKTQYWAFWQIIHFFPFFFTLCLLLVNLHEIELNRNLNHKWTASY